MADISCSADSLIEFFQQQEDKAENKGNYQHHFFWVLNGEIDIERGADLESTLTPELYVSKILICDTCCDPFLWQTPELATTVCDRRLAAQNPAEYLLQWCAETSTPQQKALHVQAEPEAFNSTSYYIPLDLLKAQPKYLEESAAGNQDISNHLKPQDEDFQLIKNSLKEKLESSSLDHDYGQNPANSDRYAEEVPDCKNDHVKTAEYTSIADKVKTSRRRKQNLQNIPPIQEEVDVVTMTEPFPTLSVSRLHDPSAPGPSRGLDPRPSTSGLQRRVGRRRKARGSTSASEMDDREYRNEVERRRRNTMKMKLERLRQSIPEIRKDVKAPKLRVLTSATKYILEIRKTEKTFMNIRRERQELKNILNALALNT